MKTIPFIKRFEGYEVAFIFGPVSDDRKPSVELLDIKEVADVIRRGNRKTVGYCGKDEKKFPSYEILIKLKGIHTEVELLKELNNLDGEGYFVSKRQWEVEESERTRKDIEDEAADICAKYNCEVNSIKFMEALESERQRLSAYQEGMVEDGLCDTTYGLYSPLRSQNDWSKDYYGCMNHIGRIESWIKNHLPLLWAKWQTIKQEE